MERKQHSALSAPTITAAQPKDKVYTLSDVYGNGLAVYIYPDGRKVWKVRKPAMKNGKRTTLMGDLGIFPAVSLKEARQKAAIWQPDKTNKEKTVRALVNDWIENEYKLYRRSETQKLTICFINKYILPVLGDMIAEKVTEQTLTELCENIEHIGNITSAARVRGILISAFKYGKAHGFNTHNNALTIVLHTKEHKKTAQEALTTATDIAAFMRDLFNSTPAISREALKFIVYTGLRKNEALSAEWWQIDFDNAVMTIPAEKMKMKKEHKIPLTRQALEILENMRQYGDKYIFRGKKNGICLCSTTLGYLLERLGYTGKSKPKTTVHGFRSTLSTVLNEHGFISDIIEKQLAHSGQGVRAIYNRAEYWEQRKATAQWYADYLDSLRDGTDTPELPKGCTIGG